MSFPSIEQLQEESKNPPQTPKKLTQVQQKWALKRIAAILDAKESLLHKEREAQLEHEDDFAERLIADWLKQHPEVIASTIDAIVANPSILNLASWRPWEDDVDIPVRSKELNAFRQAQAKEREEMKQTIERQHKIFLHNLRTEADGLRDAIVFMGAPEVLALIQQFEASDVPAFVKDAA